LYITTQGTEDLEESGIEEDHELDVLAVLMSLNIARKKKN
jgi:hypothetical protein